MSHIEMGIIGFVIMVVLILLGTHLAFTLIIAGTIGFALIGGWQAALGNIAIIPFDRMSTYTFSVLPMFMLMGSLVSYGGIGAETYQLARTWFGQLKGGLAIATIGASGLFAAVQGTSLAGSIVMGKVAYPEMRKAGYKMSMAAGTISVGGTLGILIPPSMGFILIGIMTDLSIGQLFMAGILPGILVVIFYMATIYIWCKVDPSIAPTMPKTTWKENIVSKANLAGDTFVPPGNGGYLWWYLYLYRGWCYRRLRGSNYPSGEEADVQRSLLEFLDGYSEDGRHDCCRSGGCLLVQRLPGHKRGPGCSG